ncbi:hypothetical protein N7501_000864 [Penicillium viridicatum]|nr:hypothetical protein N7501_000864 [Penicillium viridicatum]
MDLLTHLSSGAEDRNLHPQDVDSRGRRKEQNKIAQRKYRRKMAEEVRQTKQLAEQPLNKLLERQVPSYCPECSHCRSLGTLLRPNYLVTPDVSTETATPQHMQNYSRTSWSEECLPVEGPLPSPVRTNLDNSEFSIEPPMTSTNHNFGFTELPTSCSRENVTLVNRRISLLSFPDQNLGQAENVAASTVHHSISSTTSTSQTQTEDALHLAAREGLSSMISILLRSQVMCDSRDENGRTPLYHCAEKGHLEAATLLLAAGADPSAIDKEGTSIIMAAVKGGAEQVVELLVESLTTIRAGRSMDVS